MRVLVRGVRQAGCARPINTKTYVVGSHAALINVQSVIDAAYVIDQTRSPARSVPHSMQNRDRRHGPSFMQTDKSPRGSVLWPPSRTQSVIHSQAPLARALTVIFIGPGISSGLRQGSRVRIGVGLTSKASSLGVVGVDVDHAISDSRRRKYVSLKWALRPAGIASPIQVG